LKIAQRECPFEMGNEYVVEIDPKRPQKEQAGDQYEGQKEAPLGQWRTQLFVAFYLHRGS
jgi:hypothetical protein